MLYPIVITYHAMNSMVFKTVEFDYARVNSKCLRPYPPLEVPAFFAAKTRSKKEAQTRAKNRKKFIKNVFNLLATRLHPEMLASLLAAAALPPMKWREISFYHRGCEYRFCGYLSSGEPAIYNYTAVQVNLLVNPQPLVGECLELSDSDFDIEHELWRPRYGPELPEKGPIEDCEAVWCPEDVPLDAPWEQTVEQAVLHPNMKILLRGDTHSSLHRALYRYIRNHRIRQHIDVSSKLPDWFKNGVVVVQNENDEAKSGGEPKSSVEPFEVASPIEITEPLSVEAGDLAKVKGKKPRRHQKRKDRRRLLQQLMRAREEKIFEAPETNTESASSAVEYYSFFE